MSNNKQPKQNWSPNADEIMKRWIKEADDEIKAGVAIEDNTQFNNKLDPYTEELIKKLIQKADEEIKQQ